jgi:hypothetical protein
MGKGGVFHPGPQILIHPKWRENEEGKLGLMIKVLVCPFDSITFIYFLVSSHQPNTSHKISHFKWKIKNYLCNGL